jgi:hypothetical protein
MQSNLIPAASTKQVLRRSTMDPFRKAEEAGAEYRRIRDATSGRGHTALYRFLGLIHHAYEFGEEHPANRDSFFRRKHVKQSRRSPCRFHDIVKAYSKDDPVDRAEVTRRAQALYMYAGEIERARAAKRDAPTFTQFAKAKQGIEGLASAYRTLKNSHKGRARQATENRAVVDDWMDPPTDWFAAKRATLEGVPGSIAVAAVEIHTGKDQNGDLQDKLMGLWRLRGVHVITEEKALALHARLVAQRSGRE